MDHPLLCFAMNQGLFQWKLHSMLQCYTNQGRKSEIRMVSAFCWALRLLVNLRDVLKACRTQGVGRNLSRTTEVSCVVTYSPAIVQFSNN